MNYFTTVRSDFSTNRVYTASTKQNCDWKFKKKSFERQANVTWLNRTKSPPALIDCSSSKTFWQLTRLSSLCHGCVFRVLFPCLQYLSKLWRRKTPLLIKKRHLSRTRKNLYHFYQRLEKYHRLFFNTFHSFICCLFSIFFFLSLIR